MTKTKKIRKIRGFIPTGFGLKKTETQIGDTSREKKIVWHLTIHNGRKWRSARDLTMFLAEYNTVTKEAHFRNYKNQMAVIQKMGPKTIDEFVWAMASEIFTKFKEGDLFRPQYGLGFRKS